MSEKIYRAGMIPYFIKDNEIHMMFMKPTNKIYGGDEFQIAKGRQDDGEQLISTAIREAKEELGLVQKNIKDIDDLGWVLGRTRLYICEIIDQNNFVEPHYETEATKWMTFDDFIKTGRNIHINVVRDVTEFIKKKFTQEFE